LGDVDGVGGIQGAAVFADGVRVDVQDGTDVSRQEDIDDLGELLLEQGQGGDLEGAEDVEVLGDLLEGVLFGLQVLVGRYQGGQGLQVLQLVLAQGRPVRAA